MAKRATEKSKTSASSASSRTSNKTKVLRAKSNRNSKGSDLAKKRAIKRQKINKLDAKKPKKPPTAFFYFLEDFRKEFQEQNPEVKSMRDIGKACGEKWKTMTYEEKVKYYDIATEKRAEFDRAMADYIKKQESGESQESGEDSEFDEYA